MGNCCACPAAARDAQETVRENGVDQQQPANHRDQRQAAVPPLVLAAGGGSSPPDDPTLLLSHRSMGWYSAVDGGMSDAEDEWHDALSEIDLAEALQGWEEEGRWHDESVDEAIQVLKAHGHLLPADLEAAAKQDMAAEQLAAVLEGAPRVTVAAVPALKLKRSRSQHLRSSLDAPGARQLLQQAAQLAADGRVLGAAATLHQLAELVGGSVEELAALPDDALAAATPAGASLDVARVLADASAAREALRALEDHKGWMVSRDDALKVHYRHQRGTTVHSLKFSAVFAHPLEHLLALAHEFDLVVTWNKFSLASIMLAEPSIFESYLYGAQWMMKPFKNMQALLRARGFDLAQEHRCLLVSIGDCSPEELPQGHVPLPKEWAKRKLINFLAGSCLKLRPLAPSADGAPRTEGSLLIHLDPHIPFIPAFLLNFVLGVLAPYIFNQMKKVLDGSFADPQGEYSRRIAAQPQLYGLVRRRMAEYEGELEAEAEAEVL